MSLNNKGGAPTKYRLSYAADLIEFFSAPRLIALGDGDYDPGIFPTLARFACNIGVHRETLINWANAKDEDGALLNPEFFDAYKRAKDYQEAYIYEGAMVNAVNPTFAIWTAKAILGHKDTDSTGEEKPRPLQINFTVEDARVRNEPRS